MGSMEVEGRSTTEHKASESKPGRDSSEMNDSGADKISGKNGNNKRNAKKLLSLPKLGCFRVETDKNGNFDIEVDTIGEPSSPTHLVVMVNGIIGSARDWKFGAKQLLRKYPRDVIVHCSKSNTSMLTFDGVDVMGGRLAKEVISVITHHPSVQKISFVGHSLGGLVARYAIASLYEQRMTKEVPEGNGDCKSNDDPRDACVEEKFQVRIAGLEPVNFITFATPHLGSRWHKQVPLFCGFYTMEKVATRVSWCLGKTGKHLFLADGKNGKLPLLLQMASDSEDLKFMSALGSFKRRVAYANARFDHIVGWSTSSLRHQSELPKRRHLSRDAKYPHIVYVDTLKAATPQQEVCAEAKADGCKNPDMEEEMIRCLTRLCWERVDVNFSGSRQRFLAHNTIQVSTRINSHGADVIQHMVDNFIV